MKKSALGVANTNRIGGRQKVIRHNRNHHFIGYDRNTRSKGARGPLNRLSVKLYRENKKARLKAALFKRTILMQLRWTKYEISSNAGMRREYPSRASSVREFS
jgi:hypothetical protein